MSGNTLASNPGNLTMLQQCFNFSGTASFLPAYMYVYAYVHTVYDIILINGKEVGGFPIEMVRNRG